MLSDSIAEQPKNMLQRFVHITPVGHTHRRLEIIYQQHLVPVIGNSDVDCRSGIPESCKMKFIESPTKDLRRRRLERSGQTSQYRQRRRNPRERCTCLCGRCGLDPECCPYRGAPVGEQEET